jgi:hypothetical protein
VTESGSPVGTFTVDVTIADHIRPERTRETIGEMVFAEPADHLLLGSRALEGLGLMVDPRSKRLIDRGPKLAMAALP